MRYLWIAIVVAAAALAPGVPGARASDEMSAADALFAVGMALNAGDVDGVAALFAENGSVRSVTQSGEDFVGRARVRVWAERLVAGHFRVEFGPDRAVIGNRVIWPTRIWLDSYRDLGVAPAGVIVTVDVDAAGAITTFSSSVTPETDARLTAATAMTDVVARLFTALNAGDLDGTMALLTPNIEIVGANGVVSHGLAEARTYYRGLIDQHLALTPFLSPMVSGDRVTWLYGLATDTLRARGIESGETVGEFYIEGGKIRRIVAHYTPSTAAAFR